MVKVNGKGNKKQMEKERVINCKGNRRGEGKEKRKANVKVN